MFLTMMAAALLGGQVFAKTYSVKDSWGDGDPVPIYDTEATVLVDAQKELNNFTASRLVQSITLDYQGDFVLTTKKYITPPVEGVLNITTTVDSVATAWEDAFSVEGGGSITLCHAGTEVKDQHGPVQFFGKEADNTVQLGDSEVKFMGLVDALSDLAMNQVGVVWGSNDMTLVGKVGGKPTPEPTTGTLSLLALAGLCARRRRK